MAVEFKRVAGRDLGSVVLYALSTCGWCRKTKRLLDGLGVEYSYVDVDELAGGAQAEAKDDVRKWNPACSFPTLVINDQHCIVGFDERRIREALGL
jgi:glutaredoxin